MIDTVINEKMKYRQQERKFLQIFSIMILPLTAVFLEITLKITGSQPFVFIPTVGTVAFALGVGFILDLLCIIFPPKAARWLCFAFAEILTLVFLLMYFLDDSYRVYMDPQSLLSGTGDVLDGFASTIVTTVVRGIPAIILYHIPSFTILYLAVRKKLLLDRRGTKQPLLSGILAAVFALSAPFILTARAGEREKYTAEYSFDPSVRTFGLLTSLKLDAVYSAFGNPFVSISFETDGDIPDKPWEDETVLPDGSSSDPVSDTDVTDPSDSSGKDENQPHISDPSKPKKYGWNTIKTDYAALAAGTNDKTLAGLYQYVDSLTPSHKNQYTGLFKGKNLILITAEAFSKEVIDENRTPALYRMANRGIVFEDYYQPAWGGSTSTGEFSVITGIMPVNKVSSVHQTVGHNMYLTMGSQLMRLGYQSGAYHNGSYTYYGRNETHENFGYSKFIGMGNGMENGVTDCWPESDDEMFRYIMPPYIESGEPFSLYFMTVSGHCAYSRGGNSMTLKNWDVVADMDASDTVKGYHAANYELELAMEYLIGALEDAGIADDTVVVISTDHYPYGLEDSAAWGTDKDYLRELYGYPANSNTARDHSALIIWSGCLEDLDEPIVVSAPTYSLDIVPTLSNLFGVEYDSRLLTGRDVFSDAEPLVIWQDYSFKTDKGYYNSPTGVFTPVEGAVIEDGYIDRIKSVVRNKITFAKGLLSYDFYGLIFDEKTQNGG